jgi:hypothetical protein
MSIHCRNGVVYNESEPAAESVLSSMNLWFAAETELSIVNQHLLPKVLFCSEFVILFWNLVVCNKLAFTVESVGCNELAVAVEVELFCSESTFIATNVLTEMKLWFVAEIELPTMN